MKFLVIAGRLVRQITGDKRTLGIMILAPILIMTLLYFLLGSGVNTVYIDIVSGSGVDVELLQELTEVHAVASENEAVARLESGESDGYIYGDKYVVEGSDPTISSLVGRLFTQYSMKEKLGSLPPQAANIAAGLIEELDVDTYYGSENYDLFDFLAPSMMGFIIFFLVFLLSGVSFLRERISGTLERIMATSLRRSQLVAGYFLGFGVFAALQTIVLQVFLIYVLKIHAGTNFLLVLLINLTIAGTSLAMGTLFSAFARNEFQLFQFIPIVIIPQMMFCGLINLRETPQILQWISKVFPLTYGADALRNVMLRGMGLEDIYSDLLIMLGFTLVFILLNIRVLRKYREI